MRCCCRRRQGSRDFLSQLPVMDSLLGEGSGGTDGAGFRVAVGAEIA